MSDDTPRNDLSYEAALHGMQTGVQFELDKGSQATNPKHLRVGVNSTLINDAALVRLLIKKGVITMDEYAEEMRLEANRELDRYEDRILETYGVRVNLR